MSNAAKKTHSHPLGDKNFLNCFLKSAKDVFQIQVGTPVKGIGVMDPRNVTFLESKYFIGAVLPLKMGKKVGSLALCFTKEAYLSTYSHILGEDFEDINADNQDGACELLNMIHGGAKTILNEVGFAFELTLPSLLMGDNLLSYPWGEGVQVNFALDCGVGDVFFGIQWDM